MKFNEKLRTARVAAHLSQIELAKRVGITERSLYNYEINGRIPKIDVVKRIADELGVTVDYLMADNAEQSDSRQLFLANAREDFGYKGALEAQALLERATAMFAGGELDQDAKDAFFESLTQAYFVAKNKAKEKYGKKKSVD